MSGERFPSHGGEEGQGPGIDRRRSKLVIHKYSHQNTHFYFDYHTDIGFKKRKYLPNFHHFSESLFLLHNI